MMKKNNIQVSIICTCYNHEKYIKKCLESFLMQKTNFAYEILVNDDASTDNSPNIIKQYKNKYPHIIKAFLQKTNQYLQGKSSTKTQLLPAAKGKYIALCEGDDFWIDTYKLQKQYDVMEKHPECFFCTHLVENRNEDLSKVTGFFPKTSIETGILFPEEFMKNYFADKWWFQLSSYFFKKEDLIKYYKYNKKIFGYSPVGDELMLMYFGNLGPIYYINENMSCYRRFSKGSWSEKYNNTNTNNNVFANRVFAYAKNYQRFNRYTHYKYNKYIKSKTEKNFNILYTKTKDKTIFIKYCKNLFKNYSRKDKLYLYLDAYAPRVLCLYKKLKNKHNCIK